MLVQIFYNGIQRQRRIGVHIRGKGNALASNPVGPCQYACAEQKVHGNGYGIPVFGLFQKRAPDPGIECSHCRAAPYLIVHFPAGMPGCRPSGRLSQVGAKDERHFMPGILIRAVNLTGIPLYKKCLCLLPLVIQAAFENIPLQLNPVFFGNVLQSII